MGYNVTEVWEQDWKESRDLELDFVIGQLTIKKEIKTWLE